MFFLEDTEFCVSDCSADPTSVVDLAMNTDDEYLDTMEKFDLDGNEDALSVDDIEDEVENGDIDLYSDDTIGTSFDPVDMEIDEDIIEDIELLDILDDLFDFVI